MSIGWWVWCGFGAVSGCVWLGLGRVWGLIGTISTFSCHGHSGAQRRAKIVGSLDDGLVKSVVRKLRIGDNPHI